MKSFAKIFKNEIGQINWPAFFIRAIILNIPNILDIILTAISFEEEIKTYFILRFIAQSLNFLFYISAAYFSSYENLAGFSILFPFFFAIIFLGLEISSLVFFIKDLDTI